MSNCAKRYQLFFLFLFYVLFIFTSTWLVLISLEILNECFQSYIWITISKELSHVSHAPVKALKDRLFPCKTKIMSIDLQKEFVNINALVISLANSYMVQIPTMEANISRIL